MGSGSGVAVHDEYRRVKRMRRAAHAARSEIEAERRVDIDPKHRTPADARGHSPRTYRRGIAAEYIHAPRIFAEGPI